MVEIDLFSVVALLRDVSEQNLVRGQVGTVVEALAPDVQLVEFCDDEGRAYALASLRSQDLMVLHHRPVERVA